MADMHEEMPAVVPAQREAVGPIKKSTPIVIGLIVLVVLIGIANVSSLLSGGKKKGAANALPTRPSSPSAQQVNSFETQQELQAKKDVEERQHQQEIAAAMQQIREAQEAPGPESAGAPAMSAAQRMAIYGDNPNAPAKTSEASQAQAEAKQRALVREQQHQDAIRSDTVAIDFPQQQEGAARTPGEPTTHAVQRETPIVQPSTPGKSDILASLVATQDASTSESANAAKKPSDLTENPQSEKEQKAAQTKTDPMAAYGFDEYQGGLYRIFEGTVLEAVVTNHVDGGMSGPVLLMLTTDYYSHDHQQLLMPQGTRLIGTVSSVASQQQRKLFVTFHRAVCPDGFSLDFDKYLGLDPIGTSGLATKVDHGYLMAFGAAAAIGGLGGLAQIGNNSSILDPSAQIRSGITSQSSQEAEQVLNHFLNRLPVITLKEGSRARVYIGRDILIPSYAEHRVNPTL